MSIFQLTKGFAGLSFIYHFASFPIVIVLNIFKTIFYSFLFFSALSVCRQNDSNQYFTIFVFLCGYISVDDHGARAAGGTLLRYFTYRCYFSSIVIFLSRTRVRRQLAYECVHIGSKEKKYHCYMASTETGA